MEQKEIDWGKLASIINKHKEMGSSLIPLLQDVQENFGYIPPESIETIADDARVVKPTGAVS